MNTARIARDAFLAISVSVAALVFPLSSRAASGNNQICHPGSSCIIGEFLYDDSYQPITNGATCTITSRYPDGTYLLNTVSMAASAESDGWYSHTFTAPATVGFYRTEVKCQVGTEILALDKSFTVKVPESTLSSSDVTDAVWGADRTSYNTAGTFGESLQSLVPSASDIASATWGYSSRTLSTYGTLISDIWSNPSRSLTSFGTLVADIWSSATRTLTGATLSSGSLATVADVEDVKSDVGSVQGNVDDLQTAVAGVQTDIDSIQTEVTTIKSDVATVKSDASTAKSDISSVKSDISTVKSDASTVKSNVSSLSTKTDSVSTNVTNNYTFQTTLNQTLAEMKKETEETRNLVEPLVNKPIVENFLKETTDLSGKVDQSQILARIARVKTEYMKSKTALIDSRKGQWSRMEIRRNLLDLSQTTESLVGQLNWFENAWTWPVIGQILSQTQVVEKQLTAVGKELDVSGGINSNSYNIKSLGISLNKLKILIGDPSDFASTKSLFGQIAQTRELAGVLDTQANEVKALLGNWQTNSDHLQKINQISQEVAQVNQFAKINKTVLGKIDPSSSERNQKNKVLSLRGVIEANKQFLATKPNKPFASTWLEEGSVVFKTLVTNPSKKITQKVTIKYYLPAEVKKEDILNIDEGLEVLHDTEKDALYISGEVELAASESRTFSVRVEDIWRFPEEEIESLRKQADELVKPLNGTSFFAQGVILKTDIDASLDHVLELQNTATAPEAKIKAYREATIEMKATKTKLDKLKDLVSSAGSVGTMFGFVGGIQVLAVWGLIVIMTAGFIFLVWYMRLLKPQSSVLELAEHQSGKKNTAQEVKEEVKNMKRVSFFKQKLGLVILFLAFGVFTSLLTAIIVTRINNSGSANALSKPVAQELPLQAKKSKESSSSATTQVLGDQTKELTKKQSEKVKLFVPEGSLVTLHAQPSLSSEVMVTFESSQTVQVLEKKEGWAQVAVEGELEKKGWVSEDFLENKDEKRVTKRVVEVQETPTGFLRVRQIPNGQEIGRVKPFDILPFVSEDKGWLQIQLDDETLGWISRQYAVAKDQESILSFNNLP